jgi:hypothetical protein
MHLRFLEKQNQTKHKSSELKEVIKVRAEIKKMQCKKNNTKFQ